MTDCLKISVVLRGHEEEIFSLQISPDGRWLVTFAHDQTARIWDLDAKDPAERADIIPGLDHPACSGAVQSGQPLAGRRMFRRSSSHLEICERRNQAKR